MSEWKQCTLGNSPIEIIDGDRGVNYPSQTEFYNSGYCLFLNAKNVCKDGFSFQECQFITAEKDSVLRKGKLNKHDIVLTTRGTVGNIAYYSEHIPYENIRINSGMVIIRPNQNELYPLFCYYSLINLRFNLDTYISGTAQPQLPIKDMVNMPLSLPPLPTQRAVAEVLSSLDDKINLLTRQNATLEVLAQTFFRQWFTEEAQKDWDIMKISDFADVTTGKGLRREFFDDDGQYPVLGANGEIGRTNSYLYNERLIVTGRVGTHGKIFLINDKVWISDNVLIIKPKQPHYIYGLYFWLKNLDFASLNVGSTQPLITQTDIKNQELLYSNGLFEKFANTVDNLFEKIERNNAQIQTLQKLRDTLLPKLISGEVRVKQ